MSDAVMPERLCQCGCGTPVKRTFVRGHHMRLPGSHQPPQPIIDRIRSSSRLEPETGCWLWSLYVDSDGYGSIKVDGRTRYAARASYEASIGSVPDGHVVHQTCKKKHCVRPEHLEAITHEEQVARGDSDPRKNFADYYERRRNAAVCPRGHPWDGENTRYYEYNGYTQRICKTCLREDSQQRRADVEFAEAERARNRELYGENRDEILARKSTASKTRYAAARAAGRCVRSGCSELAAAGAANCAEHRREAAARTWGIKRYPMVDIYGDRGLEGCWLCGGYFTAADPLWHDHLHPRSLGGPDEPWNFAPAHRSCNIRRRNTPLLETLEIWHPHGVDGPVAEMIEEALMRG